MSLLLILAGLVALIVALPWLLIALGYVLWALTACHAMGRGGIADNAVASFRDSRIKPSATRKRRSATPSFQ